MTESVTHTARATQPETEDICSADCAWCSRWTPVIRELARSLDYTLSVASSEAIEDAIERFDGRGPHFNNNGRLKLAQQAMEHLSAFLMPYNASDFRAADHNETLGVS